MAVILAVGGVAGAHLNPAVSCADAVLGGLRARELAAYVTAQLVGAMLGVIVANLMFSLPRPDALRISSSHPTACLCVVAAH